jgi:hypothetical protein
MSIYYWLYKTNEILFNIVISFIWLLLFFIVVNIFTDKTQQLLTTISYYIRIYVCIFLIIRFNPFYSYFTKRKFVFTELDRKIAYTAGVTLLTTDVAFIQYIKGKIVKTV